MITKPLGVQASVVGACPELENLEGCGLGVKIVGMMEVGAPLVRMGWRPAGLLVCPTLVIEMKPWLLLIVTITYS